MALKSFKPTTSSQRQLVIVDRSGLWKGKPVKGLIEGLSQSGGRNNHARWIREGSLPFHQWAEKIDGPGTPWEEWYDVPKLLDLLAPAKFNLVFYTEFHNKDFNWFDLIFRGRQ